MQREIEINRRTVLGALLALPVLGACGAKSDDPAKPDGQRASAASSTSSGPAATGGSTVLADLERRFAVRLGVFASNVTTGAALVHRGDERFAMLSTFKTYAAAALLREHLLSSDFFARLIRFGQADLVENSPVTSGRVGTGMTVSELCAAAITRSDNTAGNLLLKQLGGPQAITRFARSIGDQATRLDRWEPDLNLVKPGEPQDTTTPAAIAAGYRALILDHALPAPERAQLTAWLVASTTSAERIRAGIPATWKTADKTGSGRHGSLNDVGVTWSDRGHPIIVSILSDQQALDARGNNAVLAETAKAVIATLR